MELSPGQRKAVFALIVVVLVALGGFLCVSRSGGVRAAGRTAQTAQAARTPPASVPPSVPPSAPASVPASVPPAQAGAPAVDIYRLLPFSQAGLDQAVGVVQRFAARYGTYSYTEPAGSYVASMRGLITPELAATLARGYATPGVAQQRAAQRQVATGQAAVTALRAFGPTSLTFLVTLVQRITGRAGSSQLTSRYAVTVTSTAGGWQVSDIQLASAGNS